MSRVATDIRTGLPLDMAANQQERRRQQMAREMEAAMARGISETPQAQLLRELILSQMTARIKQLLAQDETLSAMQILLRRLDFAEAQAEEAAQRIMADKTR